MKSDPYNKSYGLKIEEIFVSLNEKEILHKVSLEVKKGELMSLLGPSGCGKSTLLKTIAGLIDADNGKIFINDEYVMDKPTEKRGTVIVFQDLRLFPNMTVEGNIEFALKLRGIKKDKRKSFAKHILSSVKLTGFEKRKINQMSGGQMQRVAFARAISAQPQVLLLDEPFSSLDEELREEMRNLVLELHKEYNMTILLVTHDKNEAFYMSDRIALMIDGEIIQCNTPKEIYQFPISKQVSDYFGDCSYIYGRIEQGVFKSSVLVSDVKDYKDAEYCARVRPTMILINKCCSDWEIIDIHYKGEYSTIILKKEDCTVFTNTSENFFIGQRVGVNIKSDNLQLYEVV